MKVAIVTGANRGRGFALIHGLCKTLGDEWEIYLTARDRERGEKAVEKLREPYGELVQYRKIIPFK